MMSNNSAFVFPGQGSQSVGMLDSVKSKFSEVSALTTEASDILGYDIASLIADGPAERLNETEYTQVAMLVSDVIFYRIIQKYRPQHPIAMAGHSLGEYAALVCANALKFSDAIKLVADRGRIMQETIPKGKGAMAAVIGLDEASIEKICRESSNHSGQVVAANYNAVGQIVIAGHTNAVRKAVEAAEKSGAKMAVIIPVSVPCHCPLLEPAAHEFSKTLAKTPFQPPEFPVLSNIDAIAYTDEQDIRERLTRQLYMPVQWVATINVFTEIEIDTVIECGPGKTLSGLIKRIDRKIKLKSAVDILNDVADTRICS